VSTSVEDKAPPNTAIPRPSRPFSEKFRREKSVDKGIPAPPVTSAPTYSDDSSGFGAFPLSDGEPAVASAGFDDGFAAFGSSDAFGSADVAPAAAPTKAEDDDFSAGFGGDAFGADAFASNTVTVSASTSLATKQPSSGFEDGFGDGFGDSFADATKFEASGFGGSSETPFDSFGSSDAAFAAFGSSASGSTPFDSFGDTAFATETSTTGGDKAKSSSAFDAFGSGDAGFDKW